MELRSRRAQLVMTEITIELVYTHAPSRLPVKTLRRLFTQKKKSKGTGMEGGLEKYHFYYSSAFSSQLINNHDAEVHNVLFTYFSDLLVGAVSLDFKVPILAGKCDYRRHFTTGFSGCSENVLVAETSYQMLEVLSFCDRERA